MNNALLTSGSNKDLKLLFELSKKIGLKSKLLTEEQVEELCLANAIKKGRTGSFVDTDKFLSSLSK
ncbi:MAG: hypothetical protein GY936_16130 [Ignavibacteriae bacterium]|nr:hypothetical protein [Ignavibacteriota bacterium]